MSKTTLNLRAVLQTRTVHAAFLGVAVHAAATLTPKLGFAVEPADLLQLAAYLIDTIAVAYFRSQAPIRDQQGSVTQRPAE